MASSMIAPLRPAGNNHVLQLLCLLFTNDCCDGGFAIRISFTAIRPGRSALLRAIGNNTRNELASMARAAVDGRRKTSHHSGNRFPRIVCMSVPNTEDLFGSSKSK